MTLNQTPKAQPDWCEATPPENLSFQEAMDLITAISDLSERIAQTCQPVHPDETTSENKGLPKISPDDLQSLGQLIFQREEYVGRLTRFKPGQLTEDQQIEIALKLNDCSAFDDSILRYFTATMDGTNTYVKTLKKNQQLIGHYQSGLKPEYRTRSNQA